jgi:hypothetical protein
MHLCGIAKEDSPTRKNGAPVKSQDLDPTVSGLASRFL